MRLFLSLFLTLFLTIFLSFWLSLTLAGCQFHDRPERTAGDRLYPSPDQVSEIGFKSLKGGFSWKWTKGNLASDQSGTPFGLQLNRANKLVDLASSAKLGQNLGKIAGAKPIAEIKWRDLNGPRKVTLFSKGRVGWNGDLWTVRAIGLHRFVLSLNKRAMWQDTRAIPYSPSEVARIEIRGNKNQILAEIDQEDDLSPASRQFLDRVTGHEVKEARWESRPAQMKVRWKLIADYALDEPPFILEIGRQGSKWIARSRAAQGWRNLSLKDSDLERILPSHLL